MITAKATRVLTGWLLALALLVAPYAATAQIAVSITLAPPPLPIYEQPVIPASGYLWAPGYWAYGPDGYFWVPGTWVEPPTVGLLWTPGYWGWSGGLFAWNAGYWGPTIGFYGGVNYGFGYPGHGYGGGYWRNNQFFYNRTVNNITNVHITNVYNKTVVNNVTVNHVSYVGGPGGVVAQPTAAEQQAAHQAHTPQTAAQSQHRESAGSQHQLLASVNHGSPPIAATSKPGDFSGHVVAASRAGGPVPTAPVHARDLPAPEPIHAPAASASAQEQQYAHQMSDIQARQIQERQALVQQQDRDHATLTQQGNNAKALQNLEVQHQQQTQQLQQRHVSEQQSVPRPPAQVAHAPPAHEGGGR
jgi:hypothetical protein